jgi:hypothetical protein
MERLAVATAPDLQPNTLAERLLHDRDGRYRLPSPHNRARDSRTQLPPRVRDGKAHIWPRMKNSRRREIVGGQLHNPFPGRPIFLAASFRVRSHKNVTW